MDDSLDIRRMLVLGAGRIGTAVADMLAGLHGLPVTLADRVAAAGGDDGAPVRRIALDVEDAQALDAALAVHDAVVDALPFRHACRVAQAAARRGVHCLSLTEDTAAGRCIRRLGDRAVSSLLLPHCGLAPGVIGMLGGHLARRFDELLDLRLRVGALPLQATGRLRYHLSWSLDGLINQYCRPCEAIVDGEPCRLQPLEGHETLVLDGDVFEAFNTSGGLGTLAGTLRGRVRNLDYKTIRYPGHRDAMDFLLRELRLAGQRDLLRRLLEQALPHGRDDVVVVFASATGLRDGRLEREIRSARLRGGLLRGRRRTAIELATAAGVVGAFELLQAGRLPPAGFATQEQLDFEDFLRTPAGGHCSALGEAVGDATAANERPSR